MFLKGWLRDCDERTILATQDQVLRTNWFRKLIDGENVSDKCRMCKNWSGLVIRILNGCEILLKRPLYMERDNICRLIHYRFKKYKIPLRQETIENISNSMKIEYYFYIIIIYPHQYM